MPSEARHLFSKEPKCSCSPCSGRKKRKMWKHELTVKDADMCAWASKQKSQASGVSNISPWPPEKRCLSRVEQPWLESQCSFVLAVGFPSMRRWWASCYLLFFLDVPLHMGREQQYLPRCPATAPKWPTVCMFLSFFLTLISSETLISTNSEITSKSTLKMEPEIRKVLSSPCCW